MSFDVHVQPCRFDGTTEKRFNPFTKQTQDVPRNEPLSELEASAVLGALAAAGANGPDEHGCHVVRFADGGGAEIYATDIRKGCTFSIRGAGVTPLLAQLLFDVMVAGNWVILGEDCAIAPNADVMQKIPSDLGDARVATSAQEVAALLSGDFSAWKKYRNSVV